MANKKLSNEEIKELKDNLFSSKSNIRKNVAKKIRKYNVSELGDELFQSYLKEKEDKRTWETQMEMIQSLGVIKYKKALEEIKSIAIKNERLSMIAFVSALSYVRISKTTQNDIRPILELLDYGNLSVLCGAMAALTFDNMIPVDNDIVSIIDKIESIDEERLFEKGVHDPRSYLISAMSIWNKEIIKNYLQKYINTKSLKTYIDATLEGKISRFE